MNRNLLTFMVALNISQLVLSAAKRLSVSSPRDLNSPARYSSPIKTHFNVVYRLCERTLFQLTEVVLSSTELNLFFGMLQIFF